MPSSFFDNNKCSFILLKRTPQASPLGEGDRLRWERFYLFRHALRRALSPEGKALVHKTMIYTPVLFLFSCFSFFLLL